MSGSTNIVGITATQLLTIVFIILKLTGVITWSWLWVLSPLWIPVVLIVIIVIVYICIMNNIKRNI